MIIRANRHDRFTVVPNDAIRDDRLSWKARGILIYLLSQPDGWRAKSSHLWTQAPNGRDAVRGGLKELEDAGYLVRRRYQNAAGHWCTDQIIYEYPAYTNGDNPVDSPVNNPPTEAGIPGTGRPGTNKEDYEVILSEEHQRHSSVPSEVIPSLCADCHGNGYVASPIDPLDVERCARCNPHPRDRR